MEVCGFRWISKMCKPGFGSNCLGILFASVLLAGCADSRPSAGNAGKPGKGIVQGPNAIVCWGDSMTEGDDGVTDIGSYPTILQTAIGPRVVNLGISGQTSTQIGVRQGGVASYVTVQGGTIPANGGVPVSFATGYEPVTLPTRTLQGSIAGVEGTITLSSTLPAGTFTFTAAPGSHTPASITGTQRFIPDTPYLTYLPIFWEGRNNLFPTAAGPSGPGQVQSDIAAQVAALPPGLNYLVLPVLNQNYVGERKGTTNYNAIISLNNALAATYGTHFLDVRSLVVNAYNPASPVDVTDHSYDMPPTSLGAITAQGTLAGSIGSTDTTFTVNATIGSLHVGQNMVVDNESIRILAISGSTVTSCTRGYGGTLASHSAGAAFTLRDPTHLSKEGYALIANALQSKLATM